MNANTVIETKVESKATNPSDANYPTPLVQQAMRDYNECRESSAREIVNKCRVVFNIERQGSKTEKLSFRNLVGLSLTTFKKWAAVGKQSARFETLSATQLPNAWTTLYWLGGLSNSEWEKVLPHLGPKATVSKLKGLIGISDKKSRVVPKIIITLDKKNSIALKQLAAFKGQFEGAENDRPLSADFFKVNWDGVQALLDNFKSYAVMKEAA